MSMEKTLIIFKPDAVQRGLMGRIMSRFEEKGLKIIGAKFMRISPELAAVHYEAHRERPFYAGLVNFMTCSPVMVLALEGVGAIAMCRKMMGATFGSSAQAPLDSENASKQAKPCKTPNLNRKRGIIPAVSPSILLKSSLRNVSFGIAPTFQRGNALLVY